MNDMHDPHYYHGEKSYQEKFPIVISFYTIETLYQVEVQNLIASCQALNLETSIEGVPSFGSWELNCAYKPFFIYQKLQELKRPLLWVDADAVFEKKPQVLSCFSADIAVRIDSTLPNTHPSKVMTGTIYINYTGKAVKLVQLWAEETQRQLLDPKRTEEFWDQKALRNVLLSNALLGEVACLPLSYIKIFDHPLDSQVSDPVITHYQASRRLKGTVAFKSL